MLHLPEILDQNSNDSRFVTTFAGSVDMMTEESREERAANLCANAQVDRAICMPGICLAECEGGAGGMW